jgi:hypothetical protein
MKKKGDKKPNWKKRNDNKKLSQKSEKGWIKRKNFDKNAKKKESKIMFRHMSC